MLLLPMVGANLAQLWTWRINTEDQPTNSLKLSPNNHSNERHFSTPLWNMGPELFQFLYKEYLQHFPFFAKLICDFLQIAHFILFLSPPQSLKIMQKLDIDHLGECKFSRDEEK